MRKTFKREVATAQLVLHSLLVGFTAWTIAQNPAEDLSAMVGLCTGLGVWVYGFAGTAFGLDSFAKQIQPSRGGSDSDTHVPPHEFPAS